MDIKIEDVIYICKYHNIDDKLKFNLNLTEEQIADIIKYCRDKGLYQVYKDLSEEDYEKAIRGNKKLKIEIKKEQRNQLLDLNDILFQQLNNLMDDSLTENELKKELEISKQVVNVSQTIINNANLLLQAKKHFDTTGTKNNEVASLLRLEE